MTDKLLVNLLSLVWLVVIVAACVKGKIRWGGFVVLVGAAIQSFAVSLLLIFGNPLGQTGLSLGKGIPLAFFAPVAVGTIILILAISALYAGGRTKVATESNPSKWRWGGFIGAHLMVQAGLALSLLALYSPQVFGLSSASPARAVMFYAFVSIPGCILIYFVSRLGSPARPNLMRWLSFISLNAWFVYPTTLALLLIYAFPSGTSYGALIFGAVVMVANLAPALVMVGLAREYVS